MADMTLCLVSSHQNTLDTTRLSLPAQSCYGDNEPGRVHILAAKRYTRDTFHISLQFLWMITRRGHRLGRRGQPAHRAPCRSRALFSFARPRPVMIFVCSARPRHISHSSLSSRQITVLSISYWQKPFPNQSFRNRRNNQSHNRRLKRL